MHAPSLLAIKLLQLESNDTDLPAKQQKQQKQQKNFVLAMVQPRNPGMPCCISLAHATRCCHRFSVYNATDVTVDRNHSSFVSIATWLSTCLAAKKLQYQIDTPEQLVDDEALGALRIASQWLSHLMR